MKWTLFRETTIPMRLTSITNAREHWSKRAARAAGQRQVVGLVLASRRGPDLASIANAQALRVTLTRKAPRRFDDDNLRSAFKSVRDGIAEWLGLDDGDPRIEWAYAQERGGLGPHAVRIEIEVAR